MSDETKPTSEWEHSHALTEGDYVKASDGKTYHVTKVGDNGSVRVRCLSEGPIERTREEWSEESVRQALSNGDMERDDGLSHELATF